MSSKKAMQSEERTAEMTEGSAALTRKDFETNQEVKWCPGCGDYAILMQAQQVLAESGIAKEDLVFISGIGCSSRFSYYVDTYGMHSIHGRAPAIATGVKVQNPDLNVWVITGDGDGLSIGGNHLIHTLRRNVDLNILLFNNKVYGLTKGQYSPTSNVNMKTKSSPMGSLDYPFNPVALALASSGTFIARSFDTESVHLRSVLTRAHGHKGTSFVEIYQNCNVFNDKVFAMFTDKAVRTDHCLFLEQGKPLVFGKDNNRGIKLDGIKPVVVDLIDDNSKNDLWIHDEKDFDKASILARFFKFPGEEGFLPHPFGVFYEEDKPTYNELVVDQLTAAAKKFPKDLDQIIAGKFSYRID